MRFLLPISALVALSVSAQGATTVISSLNPDHYWTFDGNTNDTGNTGGANGTLAGTAATNGTSLLLNAAGSSLALDGTANAEMQIPDATTINTGAADDKTIVFAFNATAITTTSGIIWEHGGNTRGMSIYVQEDAGGTDRLYMGAWNLAESNWPVTFVSTPITPGVTYHAAVVLIGDPDNDDNTDDGSVFGYLNGSSVGSTGGAGNLRAASNNNAVGGISENARFHDNSTLADGNNFNGLIDEVAHWHNVALTPSQISNIANEFIPEPTTGVLGLLGGMLFLFRRRR